jgi:hypothetical protein
MSTKHQRDLAALLSPQQHNNYSGLLSVNLAQMKKWKVYSDNIRYYDAIMAAKGKLHVLDVRPYMDNLNDFSIFYTFTPDKTNPVPPSSRSVETRIENAADLYERFTGHEATRAKRLRNVPGVSGTQVLLMVGKIDGILYTTVRDGRTERYIHEFKGKARPLFCVSHDGKQIVLLGGAYDFTERGIVDRR